MKRAFEPSRQKKKIKTLSILLIIILAVDIVLSSKIYNERNMIKKQVIQTLALQKIVNEEPEENAVEGYINEFVTVKIEKDEDEEQKVKVGDKEITIPKIKVASVNDSEDAKKKSGGDSSTSTSSAPKTTTEQAIEMFENKETSVGIDVSKWQGNIDWEKVRADGIEFVMIRVGYRGSTKGSIVMDPYFTKNVTGAIDQGLPVGIYFFSMAKDEEEAIQEAAWTVNAIKKYKISLPVAYDFESFGQDRVADVSKEQMNTNAVAFLNYIQSNGYKGMMYGSKNALNNRWEMGRFSNFQVWLAHYTEKTNYTGRYNMWQYTSSGSVDGISGNVDMNIAYAKYQLQEVKKEEPIEELKPWDTRD